MWAINTCVGKICRIRLKKVAEQQVGRLATGSQLRAGYTWALPCPVLSALPDTTVGDGPWNFKGERDFGGLILSSVLRREPHAVVLTLIFLSFSLHMENRG